MKVTDGYVKFHGNLSRVSCAETSGRKDRRDVSSLR